MFVQLVFAMLTLTAVLFSVVLKAAQHVPPDTRAAEVELERLGAFAYATDRYLAGHADFEGHLAWAELNAEQALPSGLRGSGMPAGWYAQVSGGDYVLCAPLSNQALALLAQRMPAGAKGQRVSRSGGEYLVFAAAEQASGEAAKCVD